MISNMIPWKEIGIDEVLIANQGKKALECIYEHHPEIVITDIEMPEMDGYTLTAKLRNEPELNKLKIILHTSLSGVFNQAMVKKVGADNFIAKFNPDDLAKAVKELMQV